MNKLINIIGAATVGLLGLNSCTLDAVNYVEKTPENFPVTYNDAVQVLAGIYQNFNMESANPQKSFYFISMLACDDNLGGGGANDKSMQAVDFISNYQTDMTRQFWVNRYQGINRANTFLASAENLIVSEDEMNQVIGEAKFLRGYFYYELASLYGRVPLVLTNEEVRPSQPEVSVLWGQILMDLRDAATTMPKKRNDDGHVDRYTAQAMLGRAWLFYTGMYGNGEDIASLTSTEYKPLTEVQLPDGSVLTKNDVIKLIDECVNESGYKLVDDYRNLWAYTNRCTVEEYDYTAGKGLKWAEDDAAVNIESMFAVKFNKLASWATSIGYSNSYVLHFGIRGGQDYAKTFPFGQGWGAGPIAPNIINDWTQIEKDDIRREASVQNLKELEGYTYGGFNFVQETDFYCKKTSPITAKYTDKDGNLQYAPFEYVMYGQTGWQLDNLMQAGNIRDLVLIRFADVLLMQSELKEDVDGINRVRARAGLSPIGSYSLEALQNERRWELCFEGVRWNDIRRWHIAAAALDKQLNQPIYYLGEPEKNVSHMGGYSARYNATAGFFKIPETEISLSNGSLSQNPGWTDASCEYSGWK